MRSFRKKPDNRRSIYLQLAGSIESQLREAYARKHEVDGLTQSAIAEKLGVDRSVIHRRLTGQSNLTIESIADMVWGLGHCIDVSIYDPATRQTNGFQIVPDGTMSAKPANQGQFKVSVQSTSGSNVLRNQKSLSLQ